MKAFNTPYVDVKKFSVADVITTSDAAEEEGSNLPIIGENCVS